jgi:hypothetical protein
VPAVRVREGLRHYELDAEPAAYSLTGAPAGLLKDYVLNAEPGSYSITGAPATLLPAGVSVIYAIGSVRDGWQFTVGTASDGSVRDGWHLAVDHKDLVPYGTDLLVVVVFIFVGRQLVARRLFH